MLVPLRSIRPGTGALASIRRALAVVLVLVGPAAATAAPREAPPRPGTQASEARSPVDPSTLPWAVQLGLRSRQVDALVPVLDQVVLVPDAATYVDEIGRWSPAGRWPVLFDDDRAGLLIRAFEPARVIRRPSIGAWPDDTDERRRLIEHAVVRSAGGDPAVATLRELHDRARYAPPGVIVASTSDAPWTAALALAAGRQQPIVWLDGAFGEINSVMPAATTARLVERIAELMDADGRPWRSLGDPIDAITLCRTLPARAVVDLPVDARVAVPGENVPFEPKKPVALTDVLGRDDDWSRAAIVGWIPGTESEAAYRAMCSLFAPRSDAVLFNGHAAGGSWERFATRAASPILRERGFSVSEHDGRDAGGRAWPDLLARGWDAELAFINSQGNADWFNLSGTRYGVGDVPVPEVPLALQLIHSWSLTAPGRPRTVGGRLLERGAYAYVGSVHEPFLFAFVPPELVARRLASAVPLLAAARYWDGEGPFAAPWRVTTIGDPLMTCFPASIDPRRRVPVPENAVVAEGVIDVRDEAKTLMRQAVADQDPTAAATAVRLLDQLGEDQIAIAFWQQATRGGFGDAAAVPVRGPLFRAGRAADYAEACSLILPDDRTWQGRRDLDRLWQILLPAITAETDRNHVLLLEESVRRGQVVEDAARLYPVLLRSFGLSEAQSFIARVAESQQDEAIRAKVREIAAPRPR